MLNRVSALSALESKQTFGSGMKTQMKNNIICSDWVCTAVMSNDVMKDLVLETG